MDVWWRLRCGWLVECGWSPGVRVRRVKGKALSSIASGISGTGSMLRWVVGGSAPRGVAFRCNTGGFYAHGRGVGLFGLG